MRINLLIAAIAVFSLFAIESCKDYGTVPTATQPGGGVTAGIDSLFMIKQDTAIVAIAGGIAPYSLVTTPDTVVARVFVLGSTLRVQGLGLGATSVTIGDVSMPQNRLTIPIVVEQTVSFSAGVQPIFASTYGCSSCHPTSGALSLSSTDAFQNLVGAPAFAGCTNFKRVSPRDPNHSVLFLRLSSFNCGDRMPKGGAAVSDNDLLAIRKWIRQGARNN
jgi:hypothetical protein